MEAVETMEPTTPTPKPRKRFKKRKICCPQKFPTKLFYRRRRPEAPQYLAHLQLRQSERFTKIPRVYYGDIWGKTGLSIFNCLYKLLMYIYTKFVFVRLMD